MQTAVNGGSKPLINATHVAVLVGWPLLGVRVQGELNDRSQPHFGHVEEGINLLHVVAGRDQPRVVENHGYIAPLRSGPVRGPHPMSEGVA